MEFGILDCICKLNVYKFQYWLLFANNAFSQTDIRYFETKMNEICGLILQRAKCSIDISKNLHFETEQ